MIQISGWLFRMNKKNPTAYQNHKKESLSEKWLTRWNMTYIYMYKCNDIYTSLGINLPRFCFILSIATEHETETLETIWICEMFDISASPEISAISAIEEANWVNIEKCWSSCVVVTTRIHIGMEHADSVFVQLHGLPRFNVRISALV